MNADSTMIRTLGPYFLTFGVGKMQKPMKLLAKWLVEQPNEPVSIICSDEFTAHLAKRISSCFSAGANVLSLSDQPAPPSPYRVHLPPLQDRPEDLPLVTQYVVDQHMKAQAELPPDLTAEDFVSLACLTVRTPWCELLDLQKLDLDEYVGYVTEVLYNWQDIIGIERPLIEELAIDSEFKMEIPVPRILSKLTGQNRSVSLSQLVKSEWFDNLYKSSFRESHSGTYPGYLEFGKDIFPVVEVPMNALVSISCNSIQDSFSPFEESGSGSLQERFLNVLSHFFGIDISECLPIGPDELGRMPNSPGETLSHDLSEGEIRFSPDFRSVRLPNGHRYTLTERQSQVVSLLHDNLKQGTPELSQAFVIEEVFGSVKENRLNRLFGDSKMYDRLVETGSKKGLVKLRTTFD